MVDTQEGTPNRSKSFISVVLRGPWDDGREVGAPCIRDRTPPGRIRKSFLSSFTRDSILTKIPVLPVRLHSVQDLDRSGERMDGRVGVGGPGRGRKSSRQMDFEERRTDQ